MQVYWNKPAGEIIPAVVKRQGRFYTRIAMLEDDTVVYLPVENGQISPRNEDAEIDQREQAAAQRRAARRQMLG